MILPETPEDLKMKKEILQKMKIQAKEVLRRADKQKIPMEMPEAMEKAKVEVIEQIVANELELAREEMRLDVIKKEKEDEDKIKKQIYDEKQFALKRKQYSVYTIQGYMRAFLSRKIKRNLAYKRYEKFFDYNSHEYYYKDRRTNLTFWEKPKSLGSYDVVMDSYWITMHATAKDGSVIMTKIQNIIYPEEEQEDKSIQNVKDDHDDDDNDGDDADDGRDNRRRHHHHLKKNLSKEPIIETKEIPLIYYYNPSTWQQTWERPHGTRICEECNIYFAMKYLDSEKKSYCDICFDNHANLLIQQGYHAKNIIFRSYNGGSEEALFIEDFSKIKEENWYTYMLSMNSSFKRTEEEEVIEIKKAREKIKNNNKDKKIVLKLLKKLIPLCDLCDDKLVKFKCKQCKQLLCENCNNMIHSLAMNAFHKVKEYKQKIKNDNDNNHNNDDDDENNEKGNNNSLILPDIYQKNINHKKKIKKHKKSDRNHHDQEQNWDSVNNSDSISTSDGSTLSHHSKKKKKKKKKNMKNNNDKIKINNVYHDDDDNDNNNEVNENSSRASTVNSFHLPNL